MITLIAGIVALGSEAPATDRLDAMLDAMNPRRRPEARQVRVAGAAAMGAIVLSADATGTLPPPPIQLGEGQVFVADAVLWDRAGQAPAASDAERLAGAFRRGAVALARLNGDFAFANWTGSELVLGRDHFGVRPLHFVAVPGQYLAFASTPVALLTTGLASPALDVESVSNYVPRLSPRKGRYYYRDIGVARPAHLTRIGKDGAVRSERFWRLPIGPRISEGADPAEVVGEVRRLLIQAVTRRLPARGPVATHLSGGLDSTPIAAVAARAIRPEGRKVLAYAFLERAEDHDFELVDELPHVAEVAAAEPNIRLRPIYSQGLLASYMDGFDLDLFLSASPRLPERQVLADAEAAGARTIFSGWGGDQLVSYGPKGAVAEMLLHGRWFRAFRQLRERTSDGGSIAGGLYYHVLLMLLPGPWRSRVIQLTGRGPTATPQLDFRRPGLIEADRPEHWMPPEGLTFLARREHAERNWIQHRLALFSLLGAPHGIRYVYPLFDLDLVQYVMRVPGWFLSRGVGYRTLLRDAIEGLVPEQVRQRRIKLIPHPLESIRMAEQGPDFLRLLDSVAPDGVAAQVLDLPALRARLAEDLIPPAEAVERVRQEAEAGEQFHPEYFRYVPSLELAAILAQHDRLRGAAGAAPVGTTGAAAAGLR